MDVARAGKLGICPVRAHLLRTTNGEVAPAEGVSRRRMLLWCCRDMASRRAGGTGMRETGAIRTVQSLVKALASSVCFVESSTSLLLYCYTTPVWALLSGWCSSIGHFSALPTIQSPLIDNRKNAGAADCGRLWNSILAKRSENARRAAWRPSMTRVCSSKYWCCASSRFFRTGIEAESGTAETRIFRWDLFEGLVGRVDRRVSGQVIIDVAADRVLGGEGCHAYKASLFLFES